MRPPFLYARQNQAARVDALGATKLQRTRSIIIAFDSDKIPVPRTFCSFPIGAGSASADRVLVRQRVMAYRAASGEPGGQPPQP